MPESITVSKLTGFGRGKDQAFEKASLLMGTDAECDVRFDPAWDKTVSARHASLEKRQDGWWITDQSRDGTWIDGRRIKQEKIDPGTIIELGKGGPRIRIDVSPATASYASTGRDFQSSKPELFARPISSTVGERSPPDQANYQSMSRRQQPESASAYVGAVQPAAAASRRLPGWLGLAALLLVLAVIGAIWLVIGPSKKEKAFTRRTDVESQQLGSVRVVEEAQKGAVADWQPVVDMGDELFPSFIIASATMKESPFVDSPHRIGDQRAVVGVEITTSSPSSKVKVDIAENEVMRASSYEADIPDAGTYRIYPTPIYRYDALGKIKQTTPLAVSISVSLNGTSLGQKARTVRLASINDCPFAMVVGGDADHPEAVRLDWMWAAYVNENHPISDELRKDALKTGIVPAFFGYQGDVKDVYKQVFAIWYVLQRRGVRYSDITTTPGRSEKVYSQYIRFIDQSINNSQANCVDGSVLFASILRQIGIEPILVRVPRHMFVGFYVDPEGRQADFLETTMIGNIPKKSDRPKETSGFSQDITAIQGMLEPAIQGMLEPATDTKTASGDSLKTFYAAIEKGRANYTDNFGDASNARISSIYSSRTVLKEKADCLAMPVAKARAMGVMPIGYQP